MTIMKTMKNLAVSVLMSIMVAATFTACSENYLDCVDNPAAKKTAICTGIQRTVLVYMAGRNNLSYYAGLDLDEMKHGSKHIGKDQALLVFMRRCHDGEEPWLARIENGQITNKVTVSQMGICKDELYASDPDVMEQVMQYAFEHYPSVNNDYGLVLWGHGSGWLMEDEVNTKPQSRGYGVDVGNYIYNTEGKWINVPTLNDVLSRMPHLKFIFADCCNFMCLESLYELRKVADYVIGSPAEIPATGAPYDMVVPAMFEPTTYYHAITECYHEHTMGSLPLSVVKSSEMENVAEATNQVMKSMSQREHSFPDMKGMIHYNYLGISDSTHYQSHNIFYDAGQFIHRYATQEEYQAWKGALDRAVIEKHFAQSWETLKSWLLFYSDFEMTEEMYHGVSMYVPQDHTAPHGEYYAKFNRDIAETQWFNAVDK